MFDGFFVFGEGTTIIVVKLAKNAIEIITAPTRGVTDKIEVGRKEEDDGVFLFGGETFGFFI